MMKMLVDFMYSWIVNFPMMVALIALLLAQTVKIIYYGFKEGKINFSHFFETGGMPSSHSAMVCGLTVAIGLTMGWRSPVFAVAFIFSLVVMYDAMGVRRAASEQANILNKLVAEVYSEGNVEIEKLKEKIGHFPGEVFAGALLGVAVSVVLYALIYLM